MSHFNIVPLIYKFVSGMVYQVEKKTFTHGGSRYEFHVYYFSQITGELGRTGDTAKEDSGKVWFKDRVWKEVHEGTFPQHPTVKGRKLWGTEWKADTKPIFKRKRTDSSRFILITTSIRTIVQLNI